MVSGYHVPMRILLPLLIALALFAQDPPAGAPQQKKARPAPKNLKVLTAEEYGPLMRTYTAALGVQCTYCHAPGGNFASDENPHKDVARTMITMVKEMNSKYLAGKKEVTCYTCHRGAEEPLTAPPETPKAQ